MKHYLRNNTNASLDLAGFVLPAFSEEWFYDDLSSVIDDNSSSLINLFLTTNTIQSLIEDEDLIYKVDGINKSKQEFYDFFQDFKLDFENNFVDIRKIFVRKSNVNKILLTSINDGVSLQKIKAVTVDFEEFDFPISSSGTNEITYMSLFNDELEDGDYLVEIHALWKRNNANSDTIFNLKNYGTTVLSRQPVIEGHDKGEEQAYDFSIKKKVTASSGNGLSLDFTFSGSNNRVTTIFFANIEVKKLIG